MADLKYLGYLILNRKDNFIVTNPEDKHLGLFFKTQEEAKIAVIFDFMIKRPEIFSQVIQYRLTGSRMYHEYFVLRNQLIKENLIIDDLPELSGESPNYNILFNNKPL